MIRLAVLIRDLKACWLLLKGDHETYWIPIWFTTIQWIRKASQVVQCYKIHLPMQETRVWSLDREDPLEKEMATHSGILAWEIPWAEEPGRLESMGLQRVRYDLATKQQQQSIQFGPPNRWNSCLDLTQLDDLFCSNKDLLLLTCSWVLGWPDHGQTWKRSKLGTKNGKVYMVQSQ